jgi:hypothetical protein
MGSDAGHRQMVSGTGPGRSGAPPGRAALCPGPPGDTRPVDHSVGRACPWHGRAGAPARTRVSILRTTVTTRVGAAVNPETVAVPTF